MYTKKIGLIEWRQSLKYAISYQVPGRARVKWEKELEEQKS